jgi:hypothetical protein
MAARYLFAEVTEEPKKKREGDAEDQASDDGEVKGGVLAADGDIAGEFAQAEREFGSEIEESAQDKKEGAEEQESAAEFAERIHTRILLNPEWRG